MRKCKTCPTIVTNAKTYCVDCAEVRRVKAYKKQIEERKSRTRRARLEEAKRRVPEWALVRGIISDTSMRSHFG